MGLRLDKIKIEKQPWGRRAWRKYVTKKARRKKDKDSIKES
jgi:hypothetical protein